MAVTDLVNASRYSQNEPFVRINCGRWKNETTKSATAEGVHAEWTDVSEFVVCL